MRNYSIHSVFALCLSTFFAACGASPETPPEKPRPIQTVFAAPSPEDHVGPAVLQPRRRALVIGNGDYDDPTLDLINAENDARLMERSLAGIGFKTSLLLNPTVEAATEKLLSFLERSLESDTNLIFYAGHAFQINGENYLVPADFEVLPLAKGDISGMIRLSSLVDAIQRSGASKTILVLDACRDNPLAQIDAENGLALPPPIPQDSTAEILFLYSAAPGRKARDHVRDGDRNSPFTKSLSSWIVDKNLTFESVVRATIRDVSADTLGYQVPWQSSNFSTPVRLWAREDPTPVLLSGVPTDLSGDGDLVLQPDIWQMIDKNAEDSSKDAYWKDVDDLRYVAVAETGDRASVLTCQGGGKKCNHQVIATDTVFRCEERSGEDCGLYAVILNGELRRLWHGEVSRVRGSRTEGLSIAINLNWQEVGTVNGLVDYNTNGLGAIELLMTATGNRCSGVYQLQRGQKTGRFNGNCGDGTNFTGTLSRNSPETFYAEGSDSRGRTFNGIFSVFR